MVNSGTPSWINQDACVWRRSWIRGFFVRPLARAVRTAGTQSVVLDMEITTTPELAQDPYQPFTTIVGWKAITADGITVNGRIDNINCVAPAERVPFQIGPSEKVVGKIAFDVPPGAGTLIWWPSGVTSGWEWAYPAQ
jgi:hypothetical protein